jgi:SAM-dependent methyltransferase
MWPELGEQWQLTPELYAAFDQREGVCCTLCGSNLRSRQLAIVITKQMNRKLGTTHTSLCGLCGDRRATSVTVAEINSAGSLHPFLSLLPKLHYSEYGSQSPDIPSEDLSALSYGDGMFDLVVNSDTLEHVPDFDRALAEIRRVLKPGGLRQSLDEPRQAGPPSSAQSSRRTRTGRGGLASLPRIRTRHRCQNRGGGIRVFRCPRCSQPCSTTFVTKRA